MSDDVLSQAGAIYLGVSAAGLFWVINQFTSTVVIGLLVNWPEKANGRIPQAVGSIKSKTWVLAGRVVNLAVSYAVQLGIFLLSIWPWLLLSFVVIVAGFLLTNFQASAVAPSQPFSFRRLKKRRFWPCTLRFC